MIAPVCLSADAPMPATQSMTPGYNAPSHIDIKKERSEVFSLSASFLYWQAMQDNMELGVVGDTTDSLNSIDGSFVDLDTDFKPGFKVAAAVNYMPDNWDFAVEYTRYHSTNHASKSLDSSNFLKALYPAWEMPSSSNPRYFSGSESWKLHLNYVDAEMGRSYYAGQKLIYRPFIAARAPWISQKLSATYKQAVTDTAKNTTVTQSSRSWGIGPRAGIELDWRLGQAYKLYGTAGADIVYTQYTHYRYHQESTISGAVSSRSRFIYRQNNINTLRAHVDLALGLGWDRYFANDRSHVRLNADYGFQVFFNQNMFRNFVDDQSLAKSINPNGNLYVQGLTLSLNFDF